MNYHLRAPHATRRHGGPRAARPRAWARAPVSGSPAVPSLAVQSRCPLASPASPCRAGAPGCPLVATEESFQAGLPIPVLRGQRVFNKRLLLTCSREGRLNSHTSLYTADLQRQPTTLSTVRSSPAKNVILSLLYFLRTKVLFKVRCDRHRRRKGVLKRTMLAALFK